MPVNLNATNIHRSPIYEILNTCKKFGLFNKLMRMINGQDRFLGKKSWSKIVWDSAWKYDDAFWKSVSIIDRKTDMLISTMKQSHYLNWWYLSDIHAKNIRNYV